MTTSAKVSSALAAGFEDLRAALDRGEVTATELTELSLARAHATQDSLNAFITVTDELAREAAHAADARLRQGERSPLLGMPIAIKDLILVRDVRTTAASRMLESFVAPYDATVVEKLKRAGTPIVGKTNLDEFAMGSSSESSYFGPTKNPWDLARVPGGSSGGSAAAVAGGVASLSLGTDTGGSIRQPSAFCALTGMKPTYGRVSRYGAVAYASSLDQIGPMCSDVAGSAAVLDAITGPCGRDATSLPAPATRALEACRTAKARGHVRGLRIGLPREYFAVAGLAPAVKSAIDDNLAQLRELGAETVEISLPHTRFAIATYYLIAASEASSNLARYDGVHFGFRSPNFREGTLEKLYSLTRAEGFGAEVKHRILLGTYALSAGYYDAFYRKASQVRELLRRDFAAAFAACDVVASPTTPTPAFRLGEKANDPISMYLADVYTLSANLVGVPALSVNGGFDAQGLPIGFQLMAPWLGEERLVDTAAVLESRVETARRLSPVHRTFTEAAL